MDPYQPQTTPSSSRPTPNPSGASDAPDFSPRPWPRRTAAESPLAGVRTLVLTRSLERSRSLGQELALLGLATQAAVGGEALAQHLGDDRWEAWIVEPEGLDPADLDRVAQRLAARPLLLLGAGSARNRLSDLAFANLSAHASPASLVTSLGRAFEHNQLQAENDRLRARLEGRYQLANIVTRDKAMQGLLKTLESVAETRANVLINGESGTGKSMLARTLHELSDRREGPFVVVNCGALPDSLLESELFGHAKGAFTGAVKDKAGRFEEADGGTIFLDEINSASLDLQVKLLRVIQERTFEAVGDSRSRKVDVRLITATNADLKEEIAEGRFREDLYYRIHVVALHVPPLRERPSDILLLADSFLARFAEAYDRGRLNFDDDCRSALVAYPWPGNVRELENAIERAVLLSRDDHLSLIDLGPEIWDGSVQQNPAATGGFQGSSLLDGLAQLERLPSLKKALEGPEKAILVRALEICEGNRTRAAEMLEINRSTLFHKMRKYGLMERSFSPSGEVR